MNTTSHTDPLLIRCRKGDNQAFRELYENFARQMLNISFRIVNNRTEAEDILQDCFVKAFQSINKFDNVQALGGWLKKVVINRSIDEVRKRKNTSLNIDHAPEPVAEEEYEEERYEPKSVMRAIEALPDGYRLVLCLYLFEDMTHKEIAATLHISEATSKTQYMRAKQKLIFLLKQQRKMQHEPEA